MDLWLLYFDYAEHSPRRTDEEGAGTGVDAEVTIELAMVCY